LVTDFFVQEFNIYNTNPYLKNSMMTKHDFFKITLKIFGIYWLISSVFGYLPYYIETISYLEMTNQGELIYGIFYNGIGVLINLIIALIFIFKPNFFIEKLSLTNGFEDDYIDNPNFNKRILKIVILIIAGLTLLNGLEMLYYELMKMKDFADMDRSFSDYNKSNLVILSIEIVVSFLIFKEKCWVFSLLKLNEPNEIFEDSEDLLDN